ncbi:MAG: class III signal peptide-containing protein [DPANN group archaeon]|nr:class III signal peptide-containing protein [DPANN group archaeon]
MDNKGQMSAELIILMAAVLTIGIFVVQSIMGSTQSAAAKLNKSTEKVLAEIESMM